MNPPPILMESNGIFPTINNGFLGVENPLKQQQQPNHQNQQNPHTNLQHHHHNNQMVSYDQQPHQPIKQNYPYSSKPNTNKPHQQINLSDEDEPCFDEASVGDSKRKGSPWHRMKWTDTMVRLLIMAVYYIGDEAGSSELGTDNNSNSKKKVNGLLQKKGKWKSVSKGMMEKGYYVSPQQCEDKFNDLNKRYKRVNDILGKGTACRVVENQCLLDTMDLSSKLKDEARKLLNSKHLFFREMCAYHNSCGHGNNNLQQQCSNETQVQQPQQQVQKQCLHSSNGVGSLGMLKLKGKNGGGGGGGEEDEDDESEDESEEEEDELSGEGGYGTKGHEEDENIDNLRKKSKKVTSNVMMQELSSEVMNVLQDGMKSFGEKKQWMKKRVVMLGEEMINYHVEAFEIEKQRLKWARFSGNKEREMERHRLENERKCLEIDRMVLLLRQKELELQNNQQLLLQQHSST